MRDVYVDDDASAFVAPRPRAAGTPSPEALARLQAAVQKAPAGGGTAPRGPVQRAAAPQPRAQAPQPQPAHHADKPRFGINSLINRMTGAPAEQAERSAPPMRQQPPVTSAYDDEQDADPDQDRIEIPAFLRRQAN